MLSLEIVSISSFSCSVYCILFAFYMSFYVYLLTKQWLIATAEYSAGFDGVEAPFQRCGIILKPKADLVITRFCAGLSVAGAYGIRAETPRRVRGRPLTGNIFWGGRVAKPLKRGNFSGARAHKRWSIRNAAPQKRLARGQNMLKLNSRRHLAHMRKARDASRVKPHILHEKPDSKNQC